MTRGIPESLRKAVLDAGLVGSDVDDAAAFKAAFLKLDQGRIYVRICNMRRELSDWTECRFNAVMEKLRADCVIQLHAADMTSMSDEDTALSYTDKNGFWYGTLTWKGPPAMQFLNPPEPEPDGQDEAYAYHQGRFSTEEEHIAAWNRLKSPAKKFFTPPAGVCGEDQGEDSAEMTPADQREATPQTVEAHRGNLSSRDSQAKAVHLVKSAAAQERIAEALERIAEALERPYKPNQ